MKKTKQDKINKMLSTVNWIFVQINLQYIHVHYVEVPDYIHVNALEIYI